MNLKSLSNEILDQNLQQLVRKEREILSEILLLVCEVDRRKLYLDYAFPNLFSYMTQHLGYSAGSAQRRIDAARLSKVVPELVECLESGALNLAQVGLVQKAARQVFKVSHVKITGAQKQELLNHLVGRSFEESQVLVAQSLNIEIQTAPKVQYQADESVRLEVSFTKDQWAKMEEMRALLSHALPNGSWAEVFEYLADKVIQQKMKGPKKAVRGDVVEVKSVQLNKFSEKAEFKDKARDKLRSPNNIIKAPSARTLKELDHKGIENRAYIPVEISKQIFRRDQYCQYRDNKSGRKCASKWQLQIDHIKPVWAGGDNSLSNLQLLCAGHNQNKYKKQAGIVRK
jgi:5-methylcytosine-specific restriction endonuclease McrA